jgi:hypothetical protein
VDSSSFRGSSPITFARVHDLRVRRDLGRHEGGFSAVIMPSHGVRLLRVMTVTDKGSGDSAESKDNGWLHFTPT